MKFEPFEKKVWLATPTMHGEELKYMTETYETNWMSTVGANIHEVERVAAEKAGMRCADGKAERLGGSSAGCDPFIKQSLSAQSRAVCGA